MIPLLLHCTVGACTVPRMVDEWGLLSANLEFLERLLRDVDILVVVFSVHPVKNQLKGLIYRDIGEQAVYIKGSSYPLTEIILQHLEELCR